MYKRYIQLVGIRFFEVVSFENNMITKETFRSTRICVELYLKIHVRYFMNYDNYFVMV